MCSSDLRIQDNISNYVMPVVDAVNATPIMGAPPPGWIKPSLPFGITYLYSGEQLAGTGYFKDALGFVWCNLALQNTSGGAWAAGTQLVQFPVGYRPASPMSFAVSAQTGCDPVDVGIDGKVADANNIPNGSHIHLCFSFLAEL